MTPVTMHEAKTNLAKLIAMIENGNESRIVISRGDTPAVILIPYQEIDTSKKFGITESQFDEPDDIDAINPIEH